MHSPVDPASSTVTGSTSRDLILFVVLLLLIAVGSWRLRVYFELREIASPNSIIEAR